MCDTCHKQHSAIDSKLDGIKADLEFHIGEGHADLMTTAEIKRIDQNLQGEIEEIGTAVMGPRRSQFAGGGRDDSLGLVHQVNEIRSWQNDVSAQLANGGVKAKLGAKEVAAIFVAAIGGLFSLVGVVVTVIFG